MLGTVLARLRRAALGLGTAATFTLAQATQEPARAQRGGEVPDVQHDGQCHCGAVQFKVLAPADIVVWHCNCSICHMKQNHHFVVPEKNFELVSGASVLTTYRFNTGVAQHKFCSVCGVQAFYIPRSNPDGVAVTANCITSPTLASRTERYFDGENWEDFIEGSGIQEHSKPRS